MNKKDSLLNKKCITCKDKSIKPFKRSEVEDYVMQIKGWKMDKNAEKISRKFRFKDFIGAINFVNNVADIAEVEGHHPDIAINYNKVNLELTTHEIKGLSVNDFIVAAKVDALMSSRKV